jgi:hypothetical protein
MDLWIIECMDLIWASITLTSGPQNRGICSSHIIFVSIHSNYTAYIWLRRPNHYCTLSCYVSQSEIVLNCS